VRAGTPPELAEALAAVEYPSVAEDACRLDLALAERDPTLCTPIRLSALRQTCVTRAAVVSGRAEACPAAEGERGRDPFCVALATRLAGLCSAARRPDAIRCLAAARGEATQCDALDAVLRPRCRADVHALSAQIGRMSAPPLRAGEARLRVRFGDSADASASSGHTVDAGGAGGREYPLDFALRGVFADDSGVVYLMDPSDGWPSPLGPRPFTDRPALGATIVPAPRPGPARLLDLRVVMPDGLTIEPLPDGRPAEVRLSHVPAGRGGPLEGNLALDTLVTGTPVHLEISFRSFLRDVLPASELRPPQAPE
jgi:hypothetical protein